MEKARRARRGLGYWSFHALQLHRNDSLLVARRRVRLEERKDPIEATATLRYEFKRLFELGRSSAASDQLLESYWYRSDSHRDTGCRCLLVVEPK